MRTTTRSILVLSILAIVLAACGTTAGADPEPSAPAPTATAKPTAKPTVEPTVAPTEAPTQAPAAPTEAPTEAPAAPRVIAGTITVAEGMAFSGPGGTIAEALANAGGSEFPSLVNGVLFKDLDGSIYLADSLTDAAVPTFGAPMLQVLDYGHSEAEWDMANADLTGLKEANGILFRENAQILGYVAP